MLYELTIFCSFDVNHRISFSLVRHVTYNAFSLACLRFVRAFTVTAFCYVLPVTEHQSSVLGRRIGGGACTVPTSEVLRTHLIL